LNLTPSAFQLLGVTALVAFLTAVLTFAVLRFAEAARETRKNRGAGVETAFLAAALQDAVTRLKAQERATAARAEASERLSDEIISSLTAGLMVAGLGGELRILNPAGRRMLGLAPDASPDACRKALTYLALSSVIDECLSTGIAVVRRSVTLPESRHGVSHLGVTVSPLFDDSGALHGAISPPSRSWRRSCA
jgi:nitrogen fixation/metabolism regulation signal transduction histidine kinase